MSDIKQAAQADVAKVKAQAAAAADADKQSLRADIAKSPLTSVLVALVVGLVVGMAIGGVFL